ncbi:MAG: DUF6088 family protein [bacterium]|jgi:hypothetical protein|nr:DUF6088 family protein [bacterium]
MSTAEAVRDKVASAPPGSYFRPADFEGSELAVGTALSRLAARKKVIRMRNGLYHKPKDSRFGPVPPSPLELGIQAAMTKGLKGGIGPAGWSAAHELGLSSQVPRFVELAVSRRPPTHAPDGVRYRERSNVRRERLGFHDVALLEVLRDWSTLRVDWSKLAETCSRLSDAGKLHPSAVLEAAAGESARVKKMARDLFGH